MTSPYDNALAQIETADFTPKTLLAAKRLLAAVDQRTGHVKATRDQAGKILGTSSWGATRRMLVAIKKSGLIHYSTNEMVYVDFCAWSAHGSKSDLERSKSDLERSPVADSDANSQRGRATEITFRAPEITFRAPEIEKRAPEITSPGVESSAVFGKVGRYDPNPDLNSDPDLPETYLPTADPKTAAKVAALTDEQRFVYDLITDPEINILPANAVRAATRRDLADAVGVIAGWWVKGELGAGALFNALMKTQEFRAGPAHPDFLASDFYRRHYPLDESQTRTWVHWVRNREWADVIQGLNPPNIPPEVQEILEELPPPVWGGAP